MPYLKYSEHDQDNLTFVQFTCIEEFGVGDTIAPRRKHRICKTINPDTTYINLRPDIFSIIVPIVILTYFI